jgi:hypothetical protein
MVEDNVGCKWSLAALLDGIAQLQRDVDAAGGAS